MPDFWCEWPNSMVAASFVLIGVSSLAWLIAASVERGVVAGIALAIVLPPAWLTMGGIAFVSRRWPQLGVTTAVAGTGFRMLWSIVLVARLGRHAEFYHTTSTALAEWTTGFYLLTLLVETALLGRLLQASAIPPAEPPPGTTP